MSWKMYLSMTAFLTIMLSVFFIVAWGIIGNIAWHYRQGRAGERIPGDQSPDPARWKLPLWKAVPLGLVAAWLIVHVFVNP